MSVVERGLLLLLPLRFDQWQSILNRVGAEQGAGRDSLFCRYWAKRVLLVAISVSFPLLEMAFFFAVFFGIVCFEPSPRLLWYYSFLPTHTCRLTPPYPSRNERIFTP